MFSISLFCYSKTAFTVTRAGACRFPGGYGTLDELFETLTLVQTCVIAPLPIILVWESYWCQAVNFDFLVSAGAIDARDRQLFSYAETANEIWSIITQWQATPGWSLV